MLKDLIKEIIKEELLGGEEASREAPLSKFVGKRVLIRAHQKGVNVGIIDSVDSEYIYLRNSRKFWRWHAKEGVALESVVKFGIKDDTRATGVVAEDAIRHDDTCGVMVVDSDSVWDQFYSWPVSEQS